MGGAGEVGRERESEEKVEVSKERFTPYVLYHQTPNVNYCPVSSARNFERTLNKTLHLRNRSV